MTMSAEAFFYKWAGYSYDPKKETKEQGRRKTAKALAQAEQAAKDAGYSFEWDVDPDVTSADWIDDNEDGGKNRDPWQTWVCIARDGEGKVVASLSGIDFGRDGVPWDQPYRRVVEAELASEALSRSNPLTKKGKTILRSKRPYVGIWRSLLQSGRLRSEVFWSATKPTEETHGEFYDYVVGPFNTARAARIFVLYGQGNPHMQTVSDVERIAKAHPDWKGVNVNPLTKKGKTILRSMRRFYGPKRGTSVFYASKNKGVISGVERGNPGRPDMTAARELLLFIENDRDLYRQSQSIEQNLARKVGRGVYDKRLAVKLWGYLVEAGAKKYTAEYGGSLPWHRQFSTDTRLAVSAMLSRSFQDKWEAGKFGGQDIAEGTRRLGKGRYINPRRRFDPEESRRAFGRIVSGFREDPRRRLREREAVKLVRKGERAARRVLARPALSNPGPVIGEKCLAIVTTSGSVAGTFGAAIGLPDGTSLVKGVFTRVPGGYVKSISYAAPAKTRAEESYFREAGLVKPGERVDYDRPWRHNMEGMHVRLHRVSGGLILRSDKGLPVWKRLPHKTVVEGQPA